MTGTPIIEWLNEVRNAQRRCTRRLWGTPYKVKPVLISAVFGDGGQLIGLEPINDRPWYYLVRVDNRWQTSNFARCEEGGNFCDHLDEIAAAIEEEFGNSHEEFEHANGRTYQRKHPWPAYSELDDGCRWWTEAHFLDLRLDKDE
jgi:hypothetical protein